MAKEPDQSRRTPDQWKTFDAQRLEAAVYKISQDSDLRFFLRNVLNLCGIYDTPVTHHNATTFRSIGRHEAGMDVLKLIMNFSPKLFPRIIEEEIEENELRDKQPAPEYD